MSEQKKPQLHVSAIDTLSFCGEQFRRRYIENEKRPPGIALVVGRAVDASVSVNMTKKKASGELLPAQAVADVARDQFVRDVAAEGVSIDDDDESIEKATGDGIDRSVRLALAHHHVLAPKLRPLHVQRPFVLSLKGYPVDVAGTYDLETDESIPLRDADDPPLPLEVLRDTKTRKATPPQKWIDDSLQLTIYAMAKRVLDKRWPQKVALDVLVDLKTAPKVMTQESTRGPDDIAPFLRRFETALHAIESGIFVPAKQQDPLCSAKFCGFHSTCPYVRRPSSVVVPDNLDQKLQGSIELAREQKAIVETLRDQRAHSTAHNVIAAISAFKKD